jgi:ubiquinol-cytochrome c reductase cytochrome b subunit
MTARTRKLLDWLDHRTGITHIVNEALFERIPGGARWRYVWGSALTLAILTQFITGLVLVAYYSANAQGAWESVYFIQNEMLGGWLLRGIHHFTAHATVILLGLHVLQVILDGAYKAPREMNFWFGLALLHIVLGLSLTGYLLPWDQKGFWATKVATSIASITPVIGPEIQRLLVGGAEYGHLTLTRFLALHAMVLPAALTLLIIAHIYLFRRHGITAKDPESGEDEMFFPGQLLKDAVAGLAVMVTVVAIVVYTGGAELGAPADPTEPYAAARPEWYFLFLFQWLKYFPAGTEVIGAMVIPGIVVGIVALMPIFGNWKLGHRFNLAFTGGLVAAIAALTVLAWVEDQGNEEFLEAKEMAEEEAERAKELAGGLGIPRTGALSLLRDDPMTQGPKLFASNCASCHRFQGHDGLGGTPADEQSAADLAGFGSREWLAGLLDPEKVDGPDYFGGTAHDRGAMVRYVTRRVPRFTSEQMADLQKVIKAVSAEADLPYQAEMDSLERADIEAGRQAITEAPIECVECHTFREWVNEDPDGPILTGWGSREWMMELIANVEHPRFYGDDNDRMPLFLEEGALTERQIGLIVDWLRRDWYRPAADED